ncbi:MAG: ACT domain-containing protein [Rhodovibrionaceae bacterium]|nr:ACT domain-containing protein [Rhodovibrionaceae bacterium]
MTKQFVLAVVGKDRPGLVDIISAEIEAAGGSWLDGRMSALSGQFAGAVLISVPDAKADALAEALDGLSERGLHILLEPAKPPGRTPDYRGLRIELMGQDRPGIVHEVAHVLAARKINIDDLATDTESGAMSGGRLFRAQAWLQVPDGVSDEAIRQDLEALADEMMVEIHLTDAE